MRAVLAESQSMRGKEIEITKRRAKLSVLRKNSQNSGETKEPPQVGQVPVEAECQRASPLATV
jgi:hypothetical protein